MEHSVYEMLKNILYIHMGLIFFFFFALQQGECLS